MRSLITLFVLVLLTWNEMKAQQTIYFRYDKAGNRKYRGIDVTVDNGRMEKKDSIADEKKLLSFSINVFPNPTSGMLYIQIKNYPSDSLSTYSLTDLNGLAIVKKSISQGENAEDLSPYPNGVYQLVVLVGKEKKNWKIIKE